MFRFKSTYTKWVLPALMAIGPFACEAISGEELHRGDRGRQFVSPQLRELRGEIIEGFSELEADIHDGALAAYWSTFRPSFSIITNDIEEITILLRGLNSDANRSFGFLLLDYIITGAVYFQSIPDFCTTPNNAQALISQWQAKGDLIAEFLATLGNVEAQERQRLHDLMTSLTNAHIAYFNTLAPDCTTPSVPVDAAASNAAYTLARALVYQFSVAVFDIFSASRIANN